MNTKWNRIAAALALMAAACPARAQWVQEKGDEFGGSALDTKYWTFNIPCYTCNTADPPLLSTEKTDKYSVSGGFLHFTSLETGNSFYVPGYVYQENVANVLVQAAPPNWFVEIQLTVNDAFNNVGDYPFTGLVLLKDSSQVVIPTFKHLGFNMGGLSTLIYKGGDTNTDYHDDFGKGRGYFAGPAPSTDTYTLRMERFPADPTVAGSVAHIDFSFAHGPGETTPIVSDSYTATDAGSTTPDPLRIALFNLINNASGLRFGLLSAGQGTAGKGLTANVDYFHTNITAALATGSKLSGQISLEGIADLNAVVVPIDAVTLEFRTPGTKTIVFSTKATLQTTAGSKLGTFFAIAPPGVYDVAIKTSNTLRRTLPNIDISAGDLALTDTVVLRAGDATGDNIVDIGDFGVLVNTYNSDIKIAGSGYDVRVDFNHDGVIDIGDFGSLVNEYNASGDN